MATWMLMVILVVLGYLTLGLLSWAIDASGPGKGWGPIVVVAWPLYWFATFIGYMLTKGRR